MFSSSSDVQNNLAYSYANGFIFIIDPLTLNQFAMDVEDKVDLNAYGASSKDFDDILNIMLINLVCVLRFYLYGLWSLVAHRPNLYYDKQNQERLS